jgi:HK97 family phage portal protein
VAYFGRDGDIIALDNAKAGSLTMSRPLMDFGVDGDPGHLWESQPSVRIVTGEIAREVGSIPVHHFKESGDERARQTTSAVARMLRAPSPGIGAARFFEQLLLDLAVHDRWAALVGFSDDGGMELTRLLPWRISIALNNSGHRVGVVYTSESGEVNIPLDRVLFDLAPTATPQGPRARGKSRLKTLSDLAAELDAAGEWRRQVIKNGARIPAVVTRPAAAPKWDDTSFNRFKAGIDSYRLGGGNEGGFPILEDGMELAAVDVFKPTDFDTAGLRALTLIEACLLFNYPPELLGAREGTHSNINAFREMKYRDVLGSWIINLEQAMNVGLWAGKWQTENEFVELNVDAKLRGSFDEEAKSFATATGRPWMLTNEVRKKKNLPPVPDGNELVTPLNVLVGGLANPRDTAPKV